jgi:N-acetylneuraminic acid mutarotase
MRRAAAVAVLALACRLDPTKPPLLGEPGSWVRLASLPTPRIALAAGEADGLVYAVGGIVIQSNGADSANGLVEAYDPAINAWTVKARMPTPRASFGIGEVDEVLYAVGGWSPDTNGFYHVVAAVEAYDPATDTWTVRAPMPTPRSDLAVAVADGILYALGGTDGTTLATVEAYDPATDSWTTRASMPTPRLLFGAGTVKEIIYAVGGQRPGVNSWLSTVEAYDPETNLWTTKAPMPTARFSHGVGVIDGILYAVGGEVPSGGTAVNEAFDPARDTWTTKAPMFGWRRQYGAAVVKGRLYVVGGSSSATSNFRADLVDAFQP